MIPHVNLFSSTQTYDSIILGMAHSGSRETAQWADGQTAGNADWDGTQPTSYTYAVYKEGQVQQYSGSNAESFLCSSHSAGA